MCVFAVYVDVRYETKGLFKLAALFNTISYREFIEYVIVATNSTIVLDVYEADRQLISVTVIFSKRQRITLRLLYAMSRPSVVCLSVCRLSVTLVHPTQAV